MRTGIRERLESHSPHPQPEISNPQERANRSSHRLCAAPNLTKVVEVWKLIHTAVRGGHGSFYVERRFCGVTNPAAVREFRPGGPPSIRARVVCRPRPVLLK